MKRFCYFMIVTCVSVAGIAAWLSVSNGQSPEPRSILERAIEAHGGARNISKPRIGTLKGKSEGEGPEITQEETFDLPKRWKRITSATVDGKQRVAFTLMVDGKLWQWDDGMAPQESPNLMNAQPYFACVSGLLDLTPATVKLSPVRKTKVNGESAVGFNASWDRFAGDFYFSEKTGLLLQATFTVRFNDGKDRETKTVFSDYKDDDGVMLARRRMTYIKGGTFRDFVLLSDHVVTELRILSTIPNEMFTLPGKN